MDFVFLPPEVNSARMYGGPGSGALLAAAGSWDSLSAELGTTAQVYESVLFGLASLQWRGPTAEAMVASATPYMEWLHTAAEKATHTATQARFAAAAFELAHAMTVPPAAVAANRAQLAALIATNFFGQNTAAIAATEAQYAEYWAQDVTAMSGYAASSAEATQLTPFSSAPQNTNPDGVSAQQAAVTQAVNNSSASNAVSQAASASGAESSDPTVASNSTFLDAAVAFFASTDNMANLESFPQDIIGVESSLGMIPAPAAVNEVTPLAAAPQLTGIASGVGGGAGLGNTTVALGRAGSIGSMSVPASWTAPSGNPVTTLSSNRLPALTASEVPAGSGSAVPGLPGMRPASRATLVVPRYGVRPTVMPRPPYAG
jgi:PPE-repeat protein